MVENFGFVLLTPKLPQYACIACAADRVEYRYYEIMSHTYDMKLRSTTAAGSCFKCR